MTDQMTDARTNVGAAAQARRLYLHVKAGGIVIASDLSRLVQTIENLKASNARLRTLSERSPSYEALDIIVRSVCGALERAGVTDCDDPGEAIDVLREKLEARITALSEQQGEAVPAAHRTIYPDGSHSAWSDGPGLWPQRTGFAGGSHGWQYAWDRPRPAAGEGVHFGVTEKVVNALHRLGYSVPEGKEEQAARSIELIEELCDAVNTCKPAAGDAVREAMRRAIDEIETGDYEGGVSVACYSQMQAALSAAPAPVVLEGFDDTTLLNWLSSIVEDAHVSSCFELDGGIHLTIERPGHDQEAYRDQDNLRSAIKNAILAAAPQAEGNGHE